MTDTKASDPVLEAIDDGDVHDQLLGYMYGDETAEQELRRLLFALPSFVDLECQECGTHLDPLDHNDWLAWRLKVEDTDDRRTDLFCGPHCLADNLGARLEVPLTGRPQ